MKWWRCTPLDAVGWAAIDCETSGLDVKRDRLLSVGAVVVRGGRIQAGDPYQAIVRHSAASEPANILIHGIGRDAQLAGRDVAEVMTEFSTYMGDRIPVGFHAPFDAGILRRHGLRLRRDWIDLAALAPVLLAERGKPGALDEWLANCGIAPHARHDALGDAFATAQLLLIVLAEAQRQRVETVEALRKLQRAARYVL